MGGKFSKKISRKVLFQGIGLFIFFATATTLLFQNCSQVSVSDLTLPAKEAEARILRIGAGEVVVEVGASQYDKAEAQFQVGLDNVPALKQMWILDNSDTMVQNNLSLSTSFGTMFDQSNQDSLYKFDTTAYLFNTAQTVPKYSNIEDRSALTDAFALHNAFRSMTNITDSIFTAQLRTATENKGLLPGDNLGFSVNKINGSNTDFGIEIAPVLSKQIDSNNVITFTKEIRKPAIANTTAFESEFKEKLSILNSQRIPDVLVGANVSKQGYKIVDKESGLCAVARILENPNGMFSPSDMLAFTIVSDENENNVSGSNCLKRTSEQNNLVNLVNGKCFEFETPFQFSRDTMTSQTCSFNGYDGYKASFSYPTYSADIKYKALISKGSTTYKTPQSVVNYTTPKFDRQWRYTNVEYHTKSCTPQTYQYKYRRTPITYYTQSCVNTVYDGITQKKCTVITNVGDAGKLKGESYGDQTAVANCKAAAKALAPNSNVITEAVNGISATYLPNCGAPVLDTNYTTTACTPDNLNCFQYPLAAPACSYTKVSGKKTKGDVRAQTECHAAAAAHAGGNANIGLPGDLNITADKLPKCTGAIADNLPQWENNNCSPVDNINCRDLRNGVTTGSVIVDGILASGSPACLTSGVPTGSTGTGVCTKTLNDRVSTTPCTVTETNLGCSPFVVPDSIDWKTVNDVPGIDTEAKCIDWISKQSDDRTGGLAANRDCTKFDAPVPRFVYSTLKFTQAADNGITIAKDQSCGALATQFYNAIVNVNERNLVNASTCKISDFTMPSNMTTVDLPQGSTCALQAAANCRNANLRACTSPTTGGGTLVYAAKEIHGRATTRDATCASKCKDLPNNFCETYSNQDITVADYFKTKYATPGKVISCFNTTSVQKTTPVKLIEKQKESDKDILCSRAPTVNGVLGAPSYFMQDGNPFTYIGNIDEYVMGNVTGTNNPASDLITYIKNKIQQDRLNVNFTFFIRRTGDPVGNGGSVGTDYERLKDAVGGQTYAIGAPSYAPALAKLSEVLKSKLTRSFKIAEMQAHQLITSVSIVRTNGTQNLAIGEWEQPMGSNMITVHQDIPINEGDKIVVKFQNNDGYILAQLKKMFIIDQMRPDQIVVSVEHIKTTGETVLLRNDQWIKEDNTVKIDQSVVINGGDQFRVKFKNNTTEE